MEVLATPDYLILRELESEESLWCSRNSEPLEMSPKSGIDLSLEPVTCLGTVWGLIGRFQNDKLLLVKEHQLVGQVPKTQDDVFKIKGIAVVPLSGDPNLHELGLKPCPIHHNNNLVEETQGKENIITVKQHETISRSHVSSGSGAVQKTWNSIKSATSHVKPSRGVHRNAGAEVKDPKERFEKRLLDELVKMFHDTDSFYYSITGDLTNTVQRKYSRLTDESLPLWRRVDDRFFWNKFMLSSLTELADSGQEPEATLANHWVVPIIQGFFQCERCFIDINIEGSLTPTVPHEPAPLPATEEYKMILISRRSRYRAGTRYKRRGVDDMGKCANYVETEQIFQYNSHVVSYCQVRGSVPVYWSQPGYAYRPPPKLDRSEDESQLAFETHFKEEFDIYGNEVIVNLVELSGRERVIGDAYLNHVLNLDSPQLTYVTFDFHEYCRGMKFENVSVLVDSIKDIIKEMRYCWVDEKGLICSQNGTFRVNCIDCLDRTNVVETAIARTVMDTQFTRLGILPPEGQFPHNCRRIFQMMWANNGDIISRQYAGTAALKGDFTRTGERKFTGVMKDSYNSASRYYQNRFKDAYRQAAIDVMVGNPVSDADLHSPDSEGAPVPDDDHEHHERVKQVIEDCKKILIPEAEVVLGGWPLIDADPVTGCSSTHSIQDMDTVLVLTKDSYYIAEYDDQTDRITKYQRVLFEDLEKIEFGPEPGTQLFSSMRSSKQPYCIRFHYQVHGQSGYFHMFRPTDTRFFNNMAIPVRTPEEAIESLKAICESFKVALSVKSLNVPLFEGRLEKRKSKTVSTIYTSGSSGGQRKPQHSSHHSSSENMPRNISDGNLLNLKHVGSRALTNVSSHFARFRGKLVTTGRNVSQPTMAPLSEPRGSAVSLPGVAGVTFEVDSSGEDELESEDDSVRRSKRRFKDQQASVASTSSVFLTERTLSSDYSDCSDFDDQELLTPVPGRTDNSATSHRNLPPTEPVDQASDTLLESCGILTTSPPLKAEYSAYIDEQERKREKAMKRRSLLQDVDDFVYEAMKKASLRQLHRMASESSSSVISNKKHFRSLDLSCPPTTPPPSPAPEIHVYDEVTRKGIVMGSSPDVQSGSLPSLNLRNRRFAKSSEAIDADKVLANTMNTSHSSVSCAALVSSFTGHGSAPDANTTRIREVNENRYCSPHNLCLGSKMKTSHSETAIQDSMMGVNIPNTISSPIVMKKDLVLSPLSRIAKGVQTLGLNLRSAHSQGGTHRRSNTNLDCEAYENLKQRKRSSKSRIIDL